MSNQLVTIYRQSEFFGNFIKHEGKLIEHGSRPYAQYKNAPFVSFIPKGKRNPIKFVKTHNPMILVIEGHGHPTPEELFSVIVSKDANAKVSTAKYSSFDHRYNTDFDSFMDSYIEKSSAKVVADYRFTKGFSSY
jgi:hypothetical protein